MDILTVLQNFSWEVKNIPGVKNQVVDWSSHCADFWWEQCNSISLEVTVARESVEDIKQGIIDDKWFVPIKCFLANQIPRPAPSTASGKEPKWMLSAQRFYLQENGLLWLHGDLEKKQVEKNVRVKVKEEEEKADKEAEGKAEKEDEGKAEKRGWLCIPKMMQSQILHEARDTPAGGHMGADQMILHMKDYYFLRKMWRNTQRYIAGSDLCQRTNHRSGTPMGLLQSLATAKCCW